MLNNIASIQEVRQCLLQIAQLRELRGWNRISPLIAKSLAINVKVWTWHLFAIRISMRRPTKI